MKKLIVILGMHRSGTSLLSRAMTIFGASHGDNLLKATKNNKKGHWEDMDIMLLNEEMLQFLGKSWDKATILTDEENAKLLKAGYAKRAFELMQAKTQDCTLFVLKDPRLSIFLLFWQEIFSAINLDVSYVFSLREPINVARSLQKRNQFSLPFSLHLWAIYTLSALIFLDKKNVFFVDYDDFLQNPRSYLYKLSGYLEENINNAEKDIFIKEFIDKDLRSFEANSENKEEDLEKILKPCNALHSYLSSYKQPTLLDKNNFTPYLALL